MLTYDAIGFNQLLETVLITNTPAPGSTRQNHSPWLFLDAAHTVFSTAKERVYLKESTKPESTPVPGEVPAGITMVLEELPKWGTLKEVLEEIENEIHLDPQHGTSLFVPPLIVDDGTNAVVVMCTDERTCRQLKEYLQSSGTDTMMRRKLKDYFAWKSNFQKSRTELFEKKPEEGTQEEAVEDPRLKMKRRGAPPNKRRRIRGGGLASNRNAASGVIEIPDDDPDDISQMYLLDVMVVNVERVNCIRRKLRKLMKLKLCLRIMRMIILSCMITRMRSLYCLMMGIWMIEC